MTGHYRTMSTILVHSPEEMGRFGERLGRLAEAGSVFALEGDLGAGKTVLSQGVGRALGIAPVLLFLPQFQRSMRRFVNLMKRRIGILP